MKFLIPDRTGREHRKTTRGDRKGRKRVIKLRRTRERRLAIKDQT